MIPAAARATPHYLKLPGGAEGSAEVVVVTIVHIDLISLVGTDGVNLPIRLGVPLKTDGRGVKTGTLMDEHGAAGVS